MFSFLKKLWNIIKVLLVIILVCLAVYFSFGGALVLFGATFTGVWAALFAVGLAFIVDPKTSGAALGAVGTAVGTAVKVAVGTAGTIVGTVLNGSGFTGLLLAGAAVWFLLSRKDDSDDAKPKGVKRFKPSDETVAFGSVE